MKNKHVAIVGATGAVGREFVGCIEQRGVPLASLKLLASVRSAGQKQSFRGQELTIEELDFQDPLYQVIITIRAQRAGKLP